MKLSTCLLPDCKFENFVKGASNEFAYSLACEIAENPENADKPVVIYGGQGQGKTHLVSALSLRALEMTPSLNLIIMDAQQFTYEMIRALRSGTMIELEERFSAADIMIIEDLQYLAGKDGSQETLLRLLKSILSRNCLLVFTCASILECMTSLRDDLASILVSGVSALIEPPDLELRTAILLSMSSARGTELDMDVAVLVAQKIQTNARDLEGALCTLLARARLSNCAITESFAREMLRDLFKVGGRLAHLQTKVTKN